MMKIQPLVGTLSSSLLWFGGLVGPAIAQSIIPESGSQTQVHQVGDTFTITGGVTGADGQALFHSFEQLGLTTGEIATFLAQPDIQAILGRVVGGEASYLDGLLRVSGSGADLYLINPAGILFGANAQLDLSGSFAATTASGIQFENGIFAAIAQADYAQLTGLPTGYVFSDGAGAIVNAGHLAVSPGAAIALIGGQVISTGTLTAPGGEITIAAIPEANLVRLSHPDMVLNLELAALSAGTAIAGPAFSPLSLPALLTGGGSELATGLAVNPDGTIALVNGGTVLPAAAGTAIAAGTLDVSGAVAGAVAVVGDRVGVVGADIHADGSTGGGTIRIGGDYQGQPTLPGSTLTAVSADSTLTANGGAAGDGGRVILWSDGTTLYYGTIEVAGGTHGGDGGLVEVSGAQTLVYRGTVTAPAPAGQVGSLLLDPTDIVIRNGTADGDDTDLNQFALIPFAFAAAAPTPTLIYESELENSPGNLDLAIRATNTITVEDLADNALTLFTDNANPGSLTFEAGGAFVMADGNDRIVAPGRSLIILADTITAGELDTQSAVSALPGGDVVLTATGAISVGDITTLGDSTGAGSGDIILQGSGIQGGSIRAGGGFANTSRVALTATSGDVLVETITAGGGGLTVEAAQRFQVTDSFDTFVRITLDSTTDAELIDFLMRGEPQALIDAGLVDTGNQVFITFPASIGVNPGGGQPGNIVIRHGGQAVTLSSPNITIEGTGANPGIQFVSGPNADHTITIDTTDPANPFAFFEDFTVLFPPGMFPANASGTTGAILRGQGDATLVTSFQNQPFVPIIDPPLDPGGGGGTLPGGGDGGTVPGGGGGGTLPGGGGTLPGGGGTGRGTGTVTDAPTVETTALDNLEPDGGEAEAAATATDSPLTVEGGAAACASRAVPRSPTTVEIITTCPPDPEEGNR